MIVVLSFRREYRVVHHGDWHASAANDSDFASKLVKTEDTAVEFIVSRLREDPRASYSHVLLTSWDGLTGFAGEGIDFACATQDHSWKWNDRQSIRAPYPDRPDPSDPRYDELIGAELEADALGDRIRAAVAAKLQAGPPAKARQ